MMLHAILIDGDEFSLAQLKHSLNQQQTVQVLGTYIDALQALTNIHTQKPDIVFLDIDMITINGLVVAEEILNIDENIAVVFITTHNEYAIRAFELNAADYLLKPFSNRRLNWTLEKIKKRLNVSNLSRKEDHTLSIYKTLKPAETLHKIFVWEDDRIILLPISAVMFLTMEGRDVRVITQQKQYITGQTLNHWEERLRNLHFFRCHRSYLVNLDKVEKILPLFGGTYSLKLAGQVMEIPVSRNYAKQLKNILGF